MVHHIHRNLFSGFSIIHLQDVQNQTIICANYSTTLCSRVSIITTRQGTCLSAFVGMVEELSKWHHRPGDVIWFPPGEKHWHGATPTTAVTYIAIQEQLNGKVVDWMEQESSKQYQG